MAPLCGSGKRGRALKMVFCLLLFLIPMTSSASKSSISSQNLEVRNQLKRLNKPAYKSIKSPDGDIIDCVHIKHQPAFDHPLLKNHTIQTAPSFHREVLSFHETKASSNVEAITQPWHLNGRCLEGTIPIRRTKEEDILRASSIESYGRKEHPSVPQPSFVNPDAIPQGANMRAIATMAGEGYFGTRVKINVWKPLVEQDGEISSSQIRISAGDSDRIEAGWQVHPRLYGDSNPRLFTYWKNDQDQTTVCYNLLCGGFVQTDHKIALGATISPVSVYGGTQYEITIDVRKDPKDGNWWLVFGNKHYMGYWPASLFTYLNNGASRIEWGGEAAIFTSNGRHSKTQMGSGHFPREGFGKASFFRNIFVVDRNNVLTAPKDIETSSDEPNCYGIQKGQSKEEGSYFYYGGGPGGNAGCV